VAGGDREPSAILVGEETEAGDGALPALVVAVEQVDGDRLPLGDSGGCRREVRIGRIAKGALPEAEIAAGDVEVARQPVEALGWTVRLRSLSTGVEVPPVQSITGEILLTRSALTYADIGIGLRYG